MKSNLAQKYVFRLYIESLSGLESPLSKLRLIFGEIDYIIGYGENTNNSDHSLVEIGTSSTTMQGINTKTWQDLHILIHSDDIWAKVEADWNTGKASTLTLWIGTKNLPNYAFFYNDEENTSRPAQIQLDSYVISNSTVTVPIYHSSDNTVSLKEWLKNFGAGNLAESFSEYPYVYYIYARSFKHNSDMTRILFNFKSAPELCIGKSNFNGRNVVKVGKDQTNLHQFSNNKVTDLIQYCNNSNFYIYLDDDQINDIPGEIFLILASYTRYDNSTFEILSNSNGPEGIYIGGHDVCEGNLEQITYNTISKPDLDNLLTNDGAGSFTSGFTQNYIYRFSINSQGGSPEPDPTSIKMKLGHVASRVIAKCDDEYAAEIGSTTLHDLDTGDWQDITSWCDAADIHLRLLPDIWVHSSNQIIIWFGFSSSLGSSLLYDIMEQYAGPSTFTIQGFNISDDINITIASRNLAYEPVTKPDIDTLFMTDGADDFISQFRDYDYLYRFDLYSKTNLTKGNKIKVHLNDIVDKVIAYSNGTTRQLASIGKELTQQQLFGVGAWKDVTQYANVQDFYIVMIDDPTEHYPGHLRLWLGSNSWLGQSLTYETVDNATPPDSFLVRSFRKSDITVQDVHVLTPATGKAACLYDGDQYYFDRDYYILNIADSLRNLVWIKTANDDKNSTADSLLKISVDRPADVFIGYDHRGTTLPPWLVDNFTQTNYNIDVLDFASPLKVWRQHVPAGMFDLGGNMAGGAAGAKSNYIVLVDVEEPLPPVAAFDYDPKQGVHPLAVQFTNQSTGEIDSLRWDFGDGQSSVEENPLHVFTTVDTFTVSLTVHGPGGVDSDSAQVQVTELPPVAAFAADTTVGVTPLTVTFADSSTGIISSWLWNFGDGQTGDQQNPVHIYTTADTFSVSLTVTGPGGADTENKQDYIITYAPPLAAFTYEEVAEPPLTLNFHDNSTGIITSWQWDFGDGDFSTDQHPSHTFAKADTFTVILLVEGPGGSNSKSQNIIVTGGQPIAEFEADSTAGVRPFSVQFYDRSSGIIDSRTWDFGDGNSSDGQHPVHVYTSADTFTVTLTVTGPGGSDSMTKTDYIIVREQPPVAAFAANVTTGIKPLTVAFADSSTGVITSHVWNFGDGAQSSDQNPIHTYTTADTFNVTLTVTGPGGTDTEAKTDYIIVREQPPVAAFAADSTSGEIPMTVTFSDSSTGIISTWLWDFGDGQSSFEPDPVHVYTTADTFTVSLTVSGPGGTNTATKAGYIIAKLPVGINDIWSGIPDKFQLRQNYPNPFNPQTTIVFGLPKTSPVTVAVYNLKGEWLETLYDGKKPAGYHTLVWNAANRPSGVYFIKMQAGSFVQVNKCVLVK